ncbi:helix-turn-helix transcriptional regulator [Paenibacillus cymbidii]|uniref:helix-turn-helix transcriptional regulator n=1 Tax=Paenibacillus cymbidii TaxID=1639034 RepID=UPI0014369953|nr:AraC family transcriptional regulator [Paenibacillus cymbidii]
MHFERVQLEREYRFESNREEAIGRELSMHDVLEISVLKERECLFRTSACDYSGKPGDVCIFRPFEPHANVAKQAGTPCSWTKVLFAPSIARTIPGGSRLLAPFYAADLVSPLIPAETPHAAAIQYHAEEAVKEERARQAGWQTGAWMHLVAILLHVHRYFETVPSGGGRNVEYSDCSVTAAVEHVLGHYTEPIDMEALIAGSGHGKTKFYRLFKQATGLSPNMFLNRLRLQHALVLLARPDCSITEIAFECGFQSLSYFNKQFKKQIGIAPGERRQQLLGAGASGRLLSV